MEAQKVQPSLLSRVLDKVLAGICLIFGIPFFAGCMGIGLYTLVAGLITGKEWGVGLGLMFFGAMLGLPLIIIGLDKFRPEISALIRSKAILPFQLLSKPFVWLHKKACLLLPKTEPGNVVVVLICLLLSLCTLAGLIADTVKSWNGFYLFISVAVLFIFLEPVSKVAGKLFEVVFNVIGAILKVALGIAIIGGVCYGIAALPIPAAIIIGAIIIACAVRR